MFGRWSFKGAVWIKFIPYLFILLPPYLSPQTYKVASAPHFTVQTWLPNFDTITSHLPPKVLNAFYQEVYWTVSSFANCVCMGQTSVLVVWSQVFLKHLQISKSGEWLIYRSHNTSTFICHVCMVLSDYYRCNNFQISVWWKKAFHCSFNPLLNW